jgi:hypothetical protein
MLKRLYEKFELNISTDLNQVSDYSVPVKSIQVESGDVILD